MKFRYCASVAAKLSDDEAGDVVSRAEAYTKAGFDPSTAYKMAASDLLEESSRERSEIAALGIQRLPKGSLAEVAPHPGQEIAKRWLKLSPEDRELITHDVTHAVFPEVMRELGYPGMGYQFGSGVYEGQTNPNVSISAKVADYSGLVEIARVFGYIFDQKAMVVFDESDVTGEPQAGFVKVIPPEGASKSAIAGLRDHIAKTFPESGGDTLRDGAIIYGNFTGYSDKPLTNEAFYEAIFKAVDAGGIPGTKVVEPITFRSDLIQPDDRLGYLEGTRYGQRDQGEAEAGRDGVRRAGADLQRLQSIADRAIARRDDRIARAERGDLRPRVGGDAPRREDLGDRAESEHGEPVPGAVSVDAFHFSNQSRPILTTSMYGTGLKGSGLDMIRNAEDTRLRHRLHFYFDRGEGIHPESGVGGQLHRVELKNLYDADDDPLKVRRGDAFTLSSQSAILDAGFDGFMFRIGNQSGFAILLGDHVVNVDQLGQQAGSFKGSRVAPPSARMRWSRDEPFYSALADQIAGINVKGAPPSAWKDAIKGLVNKGLVKADEVEWSGLADWLSLQQGKVTKDAVLSYLDANGVRVEEAVLGGPIQLTDKLNVWMTDVGYEAPDSRDEWIGVSERLEREAQAHQREGDEAEAERFFSMSEEAGRIAEGVESGSTGGTSKFDTYQLPGGTSYREVLLTLPPGVVPITYGKPALFNGDGRMRLDSGQIAVGVTDTEVFVAGKSDGRISHIPGRDGEPDVFRVYTSHVQNARFPSMADAKAYIEKDATSGYAEKYRKDTYQSAHWDQPNVLAHIRLNDRVDADGNRVLFVEEIQSDWGQQGKREGFGAPRIERKMVPNVTDEIDINPPHNFIVDGEVEIIKRKGVPSAPFVTKTDAWVGLALKRVIKIAVDEGYEGVAFITGEQSAGRYDLSRYITKIDAMSRDPAEDGSVRYDIDIATHNQDVSRTSLSVAEIEDFVGKEMAQKIVAAAVTPRKWVSFSNLDLKVGGEGMRAFYDSIIPSVLKDVLKKVGGEGLTTVEIDHGESEQTYDKIKPFLEWMSREHPAYSAQEVARMWASGAENNQFVRDYREATKTLTQPGFTITDSMRAKAARGLPLFSRDELRPEIVATVGKRLKDLTPAERKKLRIDTAQRLVMILDSLPSVNEFAAVAWAGRAKRGWYYNSAVAIEHIFGGDAPRFAALMAALSPRISVEKNVRNALRVWGGWVDADRPTSRAAILGIVAKNVDGQSERSVLDAWKNNSVAALTQDPADIRLSGPKVASFMLNLLGDVIEVTNDAWIANFSAVDQAIFGGRLRKSGDPGKGAGYLAMSAQVRGAARLLEKLTGVEWTPVEVQETIWAWSKTLYETANVDRSAFEIINDEALTGEMIASTPDSRSLFHAESNARFIEAAGLGSRLRSLARRDGLAAARNQEFGVDGEAAPFAPATQKRHELNAAARLDELRSRGNPDVSFSRFERNDAKSDPDLLKWVNEVWARTPGGISVRDAVLSERIPHASMLMGFDPLGRNQPIVLQNHVVEHIQARHQEHGISPADIARIPDGMRRPRAMIFGKSGEVNAILPIVGYRGDPMLLALKKDSVSGGQRSIKITRIASLYSWDNSLTRIVAAMKDGSRVWLPSQELQRVRDSLAGPDDPQTGGSTPGSPHSSRASGPSGQAGRSFLGPAAEVSVLSDDALVKLENGDRSWPTATETIRVPVNTSALTGLQFARADEFESPDDSRLDDFLYRVVDKHIDTRRMVEAVTERYGELSTAEDADLRVGLFKGRVADRIKLFLNTELVPLFTEMKAAGVEQADFENYLHARHAFERNAIMAERNPDIEGPDRYRLSGLSDEEAAEILHNAPPAMATLAMRVDAMIGRTRHLMEVSGIETPEFVDVLRGSYQFYVPLHREDVDDHGVPIGKGFTVKGHVAKMATGSTKNVIDVIAHIAMEREAVIVRAEKNVVALALYSMAINYENQGWWSADQPPVERVVDERTGLVVDRIPPNYKSRPDVIVAKVNGEERIITFNMRNQRAERMVAALKNLDYVDLGIKYMGSVTRWIASVNTQYNPVFGAVNAVRDTWGATINLASTPLHGKQFQVFAGAAPALVALVRVARDPSAQGEWEDLVREYASRGGTVGWRDALVDTQDRVKKLHKSIEEVNAGQVAKFGYAIRDGLAIYNHAIENAYRVSVFKLAKEIMPGDRAAMLGKNLTVNFDRKGQIGPYIGSAFAFASASIQGTTRMVEVITSKAGKQAMSAGIIIGIAQALVLLFMDDEDRELLKEYELRNNFVIPTGKGHVVKIMYPLGWNIFPNIGREAGEAVIAAYSNRPLDAVARFMRVMSASLDVLNPLGGSNDVVETFLPTAFDPIYQLVVNRNFAGYPIYRERKRGKEYAPGFSLAKDHTNPAWTYTARAINWASGGDDVSRNTDVWRLFSPQPEALRFIPEVIFGGVWRESEKMVDAAGNVVSGRKTEAHRLPLISRFYGDLTTDYAPTSVYWKNIEDIQSAAARIKAHENAGDTAAADKIRKSHPEYELLNDAKMSRREVLDEIRDRRELALSTGDEVEESIKDAEKRIGAEMRAFNTLVREARKRRQ